MIDAWERGCFSTTTLARPRRPCRPRHLYAVPRTLFQYVCARRRNCIGQLSPFSEYAPGTARFPVCRSAIIKLTHCRKLARATRPFPLVRRFVFRLYFLMLDGQRSIVSGHFSVMLSGNWVARPFGTFFKHASAFDKVLGDGHWHLLAESPIVQSMRPRFCSRSEKIPARRVFVFLSLNLFR